MKTHSKKLSVWWLMLQVILITGLQLSAQSSAHVSSPALKRIVYTPHFDIGYSDQPRNVVHKYHMEMLDNTLSLLVE